MIHATTATRPLYSKNLTQDFQSAYHKNHSTETSLLKLINDILWGLDNQNITSTVIMNLCTAFDTVDHDVLLTILHYHFGIKGTSFIWFENYLQPRFFKIAVDGKYSNPGELTYGVPQGLCNSANLITCYCWLTKDQINDSITPTAFADDHSICKNFKAGNRVEHKTKTDLKEAFIQLKCWMDAMHLKLNPDKTEYILFSSQQQLKKTSP